MLRDPMGQFVADNVEPCRSLSEKPVVAVTEDHVSRIVPERVVVVGAVMNHSEERQSLAVDRIPLEHCPVIRVGCTKSVISLINCGVGDRVLALGPGDLAWCLLLAVSLVVYRTICLSTYPRERDCPSLEASGTGRRLGASKAELVVDRQCIQRGAPYLFVGGPCEPIKQVRREDAGER